VPERPEHYQLRSIENEFILSGHEQPPTIEMDSYDPAMATVNQMTTIKSYDL
jgi:hypothetical protein